MGYTFSLNPVFPLPEMSCFFLTLVYVSNANFIPVPQVQNLAFVINGFISFFLKAKAWSFLIQSQWPPYFFSNKPNIPLLWGLIFVFSAPGKCSSYTICKDCSRSTFRPLFRCYTSVLPLLATLGEVITLSSSLFLSYSVLIFFVVLANPEYLYDYCLSFPLECKLLEYEDFITIVYCFSTLAWHSKFSVNIFWMNEIVILWTNWTICFSLKNALNFPTFLYHFSDINMNSFFFSFLLFFFSFFPFSLSFLF